MQKPLLGNLVAAALGAAVAVVVGYLVYAAPGDAVTFNYWIEHPIRFSVFGWVVAGSFAGFGLRYAVTR